MGTSWTIQAITITYHCFLLASKLRDNQLGGPCGIFWYYSANPGSARLYNNIKTCQRRSCLLDIVQKKYKQKGQCALHVFCQYTVADALAKCEVGIRVARMKFHCDTYTPHHARQVLAFFFFFGQRIEKNQHVAGAGLAAQPYSTGIWFKMFPKP